MKIEETPPADYQPGERLKLEESPESRASRAIYQSEAGDGRWYAALLDRVATAIRAAEVAAVAAEREACARLADEIADACWARYKGGEGQRGTYDAHDQGQSDGAEDVALAIRACGKSLP